MTPTREGLPGDDEVYVLCLAAERLRLISSEGLAECLRHLKSLPAGPEAGGRARVADFGIARLDGGGFHPTRTGELLGTVAYLSPEQAAGRELDARSDVYSLGATLYHMLTGRPPYGEASTPARISKLMREDPEVPEKIVPGLSRDAATICKRALRWEPSRRYATASEMADDIERC